MEPLDLHMTVVYGYELWMYAIWLASSVPAWMLGVRIGRRLSRWTIPFANRIADKAADGLEKWLTKAEK